MVLRVRSVLFLAALCVRLSDRQSECGHVYDYNDSDEEPLKEALLLIKLIRTGTASKTSEKADRSKHINSLPGLSLPNPPQAPLHVPSFSNTLKPILNGRRQMPNALYRRLDYENTLGPELAATSIATMGSPTTIADTTDSSTATTELTANEDPPNAPSTAAAASVKPVSREKHVATNAISGTSTTFGNIGHPNTRKKKQKLKLIKKDVNQTATHKGNSKEPQDPILSQVASELKKEMKEVQDKNQVEEALFKLKRPTVLDKKELITTKPQSTLRIHLHGSTRYPIPFPENHALCYTDPKNGLCRTPI